MLVILLSLFIECFVFVSFGSIFSDLYRKITKTEESHNFIELVILGMTFVIIILSFTCLWLPSNQYILAVLILISGGYWIVNKPTYKIEFGNIKRIAKSFSGMQLAIAILLVLLIASYAIWGEYTVDTTVYHAQFIRWLEEYRVIPGLANLEERLGFNSNFLLLSAPFTLRQLLGDPVYTIHIMFAILIVVWSIYEIIKSKYEVKRIILFILSVTFIFAVNNYTPYFTSISTDALPNLIIYYLAVKAFLYPQEQSNKYLLYAMSAILLITLKLSMAGFALVILVMSYDKMKVKQFKPILFVTISGVLLIGLWCIRNVILSGYLVFPIHQIDLFSFDWKVPVDIVETENKYINSGSVRAFNATIDLMKVGLTNGTYTIAYFEYILQGLIIIFSALSCMSIIIYTTINRKARTSIVPFAIKIFYCMVPILILFVLKAPYPRFALGLMLASVVAFFVFVLPGNKEYRLPNFVSNGVLVGMIILLVGSMCVKIKPNIHIVKENLAKVTFVPLTFDERTGYQKSQTQFIPYKLNEYISVYISSHKYGFAFDKTLVVTHMISGDQEWQFQDYHRLEARGYRVEDGFRYKTEIE